MYEEVDIVGCIEPKGVLAGEGNIGGEKIHDGTDENNNCPHLINAMMLCMM